MLGARGVGRWEGGVDSDVTRRAGTGPACPSSGLLFLGAKMSGLPEGLLSPALLDCSLSDSVNTGGVSAQDVTV